MGAGAAAVNLDVQVFCIPAYRRPPRYIAHGPMVRQRNATPADGCAQSCLVMFSLRLA